MERKILILFVLLSIVLFGSLAALKFRDKTPTIAEDHKERDSLMKYEAKTDYLNNVLSINYKLGHTKLNEINFYKVAKSGEKVLAHLAKKDKFVIRYNEIGCNTCINLIFKDKKSIAALKKKYDFVVIVDFARYEDFVKWKRTSEMEDNIFWVKKDSLPFDKDFGESSYCFILSPELEVYSFFIPDSMFPEQLTKYLQPITK